MKRIAIIVAFSLISAAAFAASGALYISNPEGFPSGGGTAEGALYYTQNSAGDFVIGAASGSAYSTGIGFPAASSVYFFAEYGFPTITDVKFDNRAIVPGDYVSKDVVITATVTDTVSGIDPAASSIEVAGTSVFFTNLSGSSSYDAGTGLLTYKHPASFPDGTYTFKITAWNNAAKESTVSIGFKVKSGGVGVDGEALTYPNPFNPNLGPAAIAYRLSADANVSVYLFDSIGQQVWKRNYASGQEGGRAGYNEVAWDGGSDFGSIVGNDIYFCRVVSGGKVIGKCKIAVLK